MNNKEFLREMQNYIVDSYHEFEKFQDITKEILLLFHDLCKKHELIYYLAFGSLIGAVRDSGHIPWDYDVDVIVPVSHRDKLIDILNKELGEGYYYTYYNNTSHYPTSCLRICKDGYAFTAIHVDVFFLAGCPNEKREREKFLAALNRASYLRGIKFSPIWFPRECGGGYIEKIMRHIDILRSKCIPQFTYKKEEKLMTQFSLEDAKYCCVVGDLRYKKVYDYSLFSEQALLFVDGTKLFVPHGYEEILNSIYSDYKQYLPIEQRFQEFYSMFKIIRKRNGIT